MHATRSVLGAAVCCCCGFEGTSHPAGHQVVLCNSSVLLVGRSPARVTVPSASLPSLCVCCMACLQFGHQLLEAAAGGAGADTAAAAEASELSTGAQAARNLQQGEQANVIKGAGHVP